MDLVPSNDLAATVAPRIATDTAFLAAAAAMSVKLAKSPFTPSGDLDPATITEADFTGYSPVAPATGAQLAQIDPVTGQAVIILVETAAWIWTVTALTNLPQTIYGVYVTDNAGTGLIGSQMLAAPITLTTIGQFIDIGNLNFRLPLMPLGPN